jgi:thymidylate kinase
VHWQAAVAWAQLGAVQQGLQSAAAGVTVAGKTTAAQMTAQVVAAGSRLTVLVAAPAESWVAVQVPSQQQALEAAGLARTMTMVAAAAVAPVSKTLGAGAGAVVA